MDPLESRVHVLERRLKLMQWFGLSGLAIIAMGLIAAAATKGQADLIHDVLRARRIEIMKEVPAPDEGGQPTQRAVVVLSSWEYGGSVDLVGNDGSPSVSMQSSDDLSSLHLVAKGDAGGSNSVLISAGFLPEHGGGMVLSSGRGATRLESSGMTIMNGKLKDVVRLGNAAVGAPEECHPVLALLGSDGKGVVKAGWDADGNGGLIQIVNKTGETACTIGVDAYGNGQVGAWDRKGEGRTLVPGP